MRSRHQTAATPAADEDPRDQQASSIWDVDTSMQPMPVGVHGVLSLGDAAMSDRRDSVRARALFRDFDEWVKTQPADRNPMLPDITGLEIVNVAMEPGDLLIFNSLLAHGGPSEPLAAIASGWRSTSPWHPAREHDDGAEPRRSAVRALAVSAATPKGGWPGDPREWEKRNAEVATLAAWRTARSDCEAGAIRDC